tara:strand:- start:1380 stop:1727 length:348 start_codon:yes stop_codon:yes gene_type:complete
LQESARGTGHCDRQGHWKTIRRGHDVYGYQRRGHIQVSGTRSVGYDESFGWADPIVGARVFFNLTWSFLSTANYTFTEHLSFSAGYKIVDTDYEKDGHVYDTKLSGLVVGLTYRF